MRLSTDDRYIRAFHRYNIEASTPPRTTAASLAAESAEQELSRARSEIARVLRQKLAMRAYPFAPGSRPFCLQPSEVE
jgi:hypothetical protein